MKNQKDLLSNPLSFIYEFINIDKVDKMECSRCKHLYKLEFIKMINNKVYCLVCVPSLTGNKKDENNKNDEYPVKEIIMSAFTIIDDYS